MVDKMDRLLAAARRRDALTRAIFVLSEAKKDTRAATKQLKRTARDEGEVVTYATNRTGCVTSEIDAAIRGLRRERRRVNQSISRAKLG